MLKRYHFNNQLRAYGSKWRLAGLICNVFNIDKRWCIERATAFGESFNNDSLDAFQDSCY